MAAYVLPVFEWLVWSTTLLAGLWFAVGIRQAAVRRAPPPLWPRLILSLALVVFPVIFLLIPFSKLHIIWLLPLAWYLSLMAGVSYIPLVSKMLIWPAYFYAYILVAGTGVSISSPSKQSPWAAKHVRKRMSDSMEVRAVLRVLDEADKRFDCPAFRRVKYQIEEALRSQLDAVAGKIRDGLSPREAVYSQIANIAGNLVESGQFHIYRGVLSPITGGEDLLRIFDAAVDELVQIGAVDEASAAEQKAGVRENIKTVG
ncbi:hypothetical protein LCGC14_1613100 [marine sediment metagenome]|uniref:Uncharacterized protein n=1 Tax=marine sediment metagenome TaxID=412755 RepID=A0A0F9KNF9_9ZZZZ